MANIIIYTTDHCPYCVRAKMLFQNKGVAFSEIRVDQDEQKREEMIEKSGRKTVPQIFIDNFHVGGCDDLYALNHAGKLDELLKK